MKVFISWSGQSSKNLAEALKQWLPGVIQAVKPYYSPDDISKGSRWANEISKELDASRIGIICLTKENLGAPWIMFEAGALSKNIDKSKVCPILFDVDTSDIQGPLVPFQAAKFSKEEIRKVIKMVNAELGENSLSSEVLDSVFEMWWPKLKESVEKILKETTVERKKSSRSERDILEEILELTRASAISKERLLFERDVMIHPAALEDLVKTYENISCELESLNGLLNAIGIIDAITSLERPLRYLIDNSNNIPDTDRRKFMNILDVSSRKLRKIYHETELANDLSFTPLKRTKKVKSIKLS